MTRTVTLYLSAVFALLAFALYCSFSPARAQTTEGDMPPLSRFGVIALPDSLILCRPDSADHATCVPVPHGCYLLVPKDQGIVPGER